MAGHGAGNILLLNDTGNDTGDKKTTDNKCDGGLP